MAQNFEISKKYIRICKLYEFKYHDFNAGLEAVDSYRRLCSAFGQDLVSYKTVANCYGNFQLRIWNIEDEPRSGRPLEIDN